MMLFTWFYHYYRDFKQIEFDSTLMDGMLTYRETFFHDCTIQNIVIRVGFKGYKSLWKQLAVRKRSKNNGFCPGIN